MVLKSSYVDTELEKPWLEGYGALVGKSGPEKVDFSKVSFLKSAILQG